MYLKWNTVFQKKSNYGCKLVWRWLTFFPCFCSAVSRACPCTYPRSSFCYHPCHRIFFALCFSPIVCRRSCPSSRCFSCDHPESRCGFDDGSSVSMNPNPSGPANDFAGRCFPYTGNPCAGNDCSTCFSHLCPPDHPFSNLQVYFSPFPSVSVLDQFLSSHRHRDSSCCSVSHRTFGSTSVRSREDRRAVAASGSALAFCYTNCCPISRHPPSWLPSLSPLSRFHEQSRCTQYCSSSFLSISYPVSAIAVWLKQKRISIKSKN